MTIDRKITILGQVPVSPGLIFEIRLIFEKRPPKKRTVLDQHISSFSSHLGEPRATGHDAL
jgi:hypothetical protein